MAKKTLDKVDERMELIVFGYCHDHEKKWCLNIAALVKHICLKYYKIHEEFTIYGKYLKINDSKDIVEASDHKESMMGAYGTVYGNIDIGNDPSISEYKWKFKILDAPSGPAHTSLDPQFHVVIGIDSSNKSIIDDCVFYDGINHNPYFGITVLGTIRRYDSSRWLQRFDRILQKGDEIEMIMKPKNGTLEFVLNGKNHGVAVKDKILKNTVYHLAIFVNEKVGKQTKIQLIKFVAM